MNILVLGSGVYVTGRGVQGYGTVLPSLAQASKKISIDKITLVGINPENEKYILETTKNINIILSTDIKVEYQSIGDNNLSNAITELCKNKNIECSIVVLPDHLHFEAAKALIQNNIHTLVVKPLVTNLKHAKELLRLQVKHEVYGAVEFHKRYDESNLYVKKIIKENQLGDIQYITVDYSQKIQVPLVSFKQWSAKTNVFQYLGVHYVDIIYFITGYVPVGLMAYGMYGILKSNNIDSYDSIHVTIEWCHPEERNSKFISTFNTNWIDPDCSTSMSNQKYKIIGTTGRIECDQKNRGIELVSESKGVLHVNPYFSEFLYDENGHNLFQGYGYKSIYQYLSDTQAIIEKKINWWELCDIRPTFKDTYYSIAVIEAVNKALLTPKEWRNIDASI